MAPVLLSIPLLAALLWVATLIVESGPYDPGAVLLMGLGLIATTTVATVGLALTGGQWARRTARTAMIGSFAIAVVRPIDQMWIVAAIASSAALVALSSKPVAGMTRRLPAATGPPGRAVLLTLLLLGAPLAIGVASLTGTNLFTVVIAVGALYTALAYSRVLPGGLLLARYGWPALAIALAPAQPLPTAIACVLTAVIMVVVASDGSVKSAFYPPTEQGTVYAIPPELAPGEVLDAADLDETGKRR